MSSPLNNLLLSAVLIAVPVGGFSLAEIYLVPAAPASTAPAPSLGDLSAYKTIVRDSQAIAAGGDLAAAERRITDFESLWDQNATRLRQADRAGWTAVDTAADAAFSALRAHAPEPAQVTATLAALMAALDAPAPAAAAGPAQSVAGIAVTDAAGHPLPCEDMIAQVRTALAGAPPSAAVADLQARALERCNADDDTHADAFSAQALSLIQG